MSDRERTTNLERNKIMVKMNEAQKSELLKTPEAEALGGVTRGYFVYLRRIGKGPAYLQKGSRIFYRREDVKAWEQENQFVVVKPTAK
jgi:hypothetical protein